MTVMDSSRNISNSDFSGAKFGDNVNFQGDDVRQNHIDIEGPIGEALTKLFEEISKLQNDEEKQGAMDDATKLMESVKADNFERAKKYFHRLPQAIQTCAAAVSLARILGWI